MQAIPPLNNTILRAAGIKLLIILSQGLQARGSFPGPEHFLQFDSSYTGACSHSPPQFTLDVNGMEISSDEFRRETDSSYLHRTGRLRAFVQSTISDSTGSTTIEIENLSGDTLEIENFVPLGRSPLRPYITGHGPPGLTRATLFRPGSGPVGLIVPDNAWEMGFTVAERPTDGEGTRGGLALLARRVSWSSASRRRYSTHLYPGGSVTYRIYAEPYTGNWKAGLRKVFRDRWLYDLEEFDRTLYERSDLRWIRDAYLAVLQFAWDQDFYSAEEASYAPFREFIHRYDRVHGGYDIYALWPGWPRLGLDPRNQWDLFRDLPGGTDSIRFLSRYCREKNVAFFISYNPWDESTRQENHLEGMTCIIRDTEADGVVLDTRGGSSRELQEAADRAKKGVIMYSEGMAVAGDMPGIVSGRVHNAIRMSPPLNLNRLIKSEFQIFRVLDLRDGRPRRELAISLFNGYGVELNLFSPAEPWWLEEEYRFMGRCLMILRENSRAFHDPSWEPLITSSDSIWVNRWQHGDKSVYTILSLNPAGWHGSLIPLPDAEEGERQKAGSGPDRHWISLWDHKEINPVVIQGRQWIPVRADPFSPAFTGTRREGSVQVIASFPELIRSTRERDSIHILCAGGDRLVVWKGNPSYGNSDLKEYLLGPNKRIGLSSEEWLHHPEGKLVIQLFDGRELIDEVILRPGLAIPVRIQESGPDPFPDSSRAIRTAPGKPSLSAIQSRTCPEGMVPVPGAEYQFYRGNEADFIPYPFNFDSLHVTIDAFCIDRYPVTNRQYHDFIRASGYVPRDTTNYLKHWNAGHYPDTLANHPVVWVSPEDAGAYALWAGKRLPAEVEWQYAAQGTDGRRWPWGKLFDSTRCNYSSGGTTPVDAHPDGASPFGVEDLTGNVWQICSDVYTNGSFTFCMIRGGSWFRPTSSWWYIQGGPQPNDRTQMLLKTAPGFDRNATVGFRCVGDR